MGNLTSTLNSVTGTVNGVIGDLGSASSLTPGTDSGSSGYCLPQGESCLFGYIGPNAFDTPCCQGLTCYPLSSQAGICVTGPDDTILQSVTTEVTSSDPFDGYYPTDGVPDYSDASSTTEIFSSTSVYTYIMTASDIVSSSLPTLSVTPATTSNITLNAFVTSTPSATYIPSTFTTSYYSTSMLMDSDDGNFH